MNDAKAVVLQADFEGTQSREYVLAGWESNPGSESVLNLDQTQSHSGNTSLILDRSSGSGSLLKTNIINLMRNFMTL